jgi:hypothetical protein
MTEHAHETIFSGINLPKVIAGTLAAVSAAVVGSFLGVAGTLAGAAVASIIGSVGTEIYERSLQRGAKKLQTLTPTFIKAPAAVGTPQVAAATEDDLPSHTVPEEARKRQIRWGRVAMIAGAVFVLAMGSLTIFELLTGESVASTVGNNSGGGTTIGSIIDGGKSASTPAPTPSTTPTGSPSDSTTTQPTAPPTDATTAPTTDAPTTAPTTVAPTTGAPAQTTAPGAGGNAGIDPQGNVPTGGATAGQ